MRQRLRFLIGVVSVAERLRGRDQPLESRGGELPEPEWPDSGFVGDRYAPVTYYLIKNEARWIHRRVEKVEFLDKGRLRRQMSVDLTAPDFAGHEIRYLPLSIVVKHVLRDFDVRDENDRSLPVLTREQNGPIAAAILLGNAQQVLENAITLRPHERSLTPALERDLRAIVGTERSGDVDAPQALERLLAPDPSLGDFNQRSALAADETMAADIGEFYEQFILFIDLPLKAGERRVVKFSYEQTLRPLRPNVLIRLLRLPSYLLETLGLVSYHTGVPAQAALDSRSYHVEFVAPEEVFFTRTRLRARQREQKSWLQRRLGRQLRPLDSEYGTERSHLYAIGVSPDDYDAAFVDVDLSLRPGGLLVAAFLSSLFTTSMLWGGIYLHSRGVAPHRTEATALLVVLPAVFAAFLVPAEHPLTRRMFKGLRFLILLTAAIAFTAAALLAVDLRERPDIHVWFLRFDNLTTLRGWRLLAWASMLITATVFLSLALAWLRRYVLPSVRKKPTPSA